MGASILVVGAGAIGGVTAAKMVGQVRRVAVLDANQEHVERMANPGLLLDDLGDERRIPIAAYTDPSELDGDFDFALITLKAPYLESALPPLRERRVARTFVSLGNGLVQDRVASIVGGENLIVGTVEWGATNLGPGHLARTTEAPFVIGELDGRIRERTRLLADVLGTMTGVRLTNNIRGQIWSKLLVNSAFSGLGAVSGLLYGEVAEDDAGRDAIFALWREGFEVGRVQKLEMEEVVGLAPRTLFVRGPEDLPDAKKALSAMMERFGPTKASMLQDLERGLKTEVDVINGGVVEKGRKHGVRTPLNERVVELVHAMEKRERRPGRDVFDELLRISTSGGHRRAEY